jgi:hypothetical protein
MNASGDAAEQIVRMTLQGVEVAGKMSMDGAEKLVKLILASLKDTKRTKGRASLNTMLKSKKPIKVFEIKDKDLKKFCQEAKKYGVMYHVLKDRNAKDGKCDIMVRSEDASKVNRIFQRFNLGANNKATIRASLEKSRGEMKKPQEKQKPEKSAEDRFIDELFAKPSQKEKSYLENPSMAKTEKSRPSEPTSGTNDLRNYTRDKKSSRPSVRAQLAEIKEERKSTAKGKPTVQKSKTKTKGAKTNGKSR